HVGLQLARSIPERLAAHGGIERENEPSALPRPGGGGQTPHLIEERVDLRAGGGRRRCAGALRRRPGLIVTVVGPGTAGSPGRDSRPLIRWPYGGARAS